MSISLNRRRTFATGLATLTLLLSGSQLAMAKQVTPDVPSDLRVPEGNSLFLVGHAVGVQIYQCATTPTGTAWTLLAPRADLYGDNGRVIATHYAGPTWEATDGSRAVGKKEAGVIVDPTAIPWLKLSAVSTSVGPDGERLAQTTFVQRVNTTGGLAPAASQCDVTSVGTQIEVDYTADYYFWR
jgi:Protein of unknown function (DUF3455)